MSSILGESPGEYASSWISLNRSQGHWTSETFGDYLRIHASKRPTQLAVVDNGETISWADLLNEVERVSAGLAGLGIGHGDAVAVQLVNSIELAVSILAIWELGAIYQPLNPVYRKAECTALIGAVEPEAVIASNKTEEFDHPGLLDEVIADLDISPHKVIVGSKRTNWTSFQDLNGPTPKFSRDSLDPAIFGTTSGTTGTPKIYIHIQATQIFEAKILSEGLELGPEDVMLAAAPITHRGALMVGLMTSLISGSRLVMGDGRNVTALAEIIEQQNVTSFMGSPTIVSDLLHHHQNVDFDATSLRVVIASGAPVTDDLLKRFQAQWPNAVVATGYGLSETGWCTYLRIGDPVEKIYTSGRLAPATEIELRDPQGTVLHPREIGEVHIKGPMTCAGYLDNEAATRQALDDNGWFASGDLAYLDDDGYIVPVGRSKHTIIRGGLNIYAEEIEMMLQEHPAIKEVAVVAYPDNRMGERACACVSLQPGETFDLSDLRAFFGALDTARYTWPERVEILDALPRNPIGKIDRLSIAKLI